MAMCIFLCLNKTGIMFVSAKYIRLEHIIPLLFVLRQHFFDFSKLNYYMIRKYGNLGFLKLCISYKWGLAYFYWDLNDTL